MAYPYRNSAQSSRDDVPYSSLAGNPLSPQRNPNRLSGGMMTSNDARGSLTRRFTTNALPTLSPIGQQRRQAAGEGTMVSLDSSHHMHCTRIEFGWEGRGERRAVHSQGLEDLKKGGELSVGVVVRADGGRDGEEPCSTPSHKRGHSCWGAIGDERPNSSGGGESEFGRPADVFFLLDANHADEPWLTPEEKAAGAYSRVNPSERRIRHIEGLLEQQRKIAAELEQVDHETRLEVEEGLRHERAVTQMIAQSEPTTPPEYQNTLPTVASRPNRYSNASLTSTPGFGSRANRSSTHLTSPPTGLVRPYTATTTSTIPSQSVPGSRRHSDDEEEEDDFLFGDYETAIHRAAANPNRNSMPVTALDRKRNAADLSSALGPLNTTSFLFDDEEKSSFIPNKSSTKTSPPDTKTYLQVQHTADGFPKLIRRGDNGELVSGLPTGLDLAGPGSEQQVTDRATATRHRISLPPSALSSNGNIAPLNSILANAESKSAANNRRSMEVKFTAETKRPALMASPPHGLANGLPKAQSSYSTNDIPTLKSINGDNTGGVPITSPSAQPNKIVHVTSEQNSGTISRVTSGSITSNLNRQSQDYTSTAQLQENSNDSFDSLQSGLQANAAPFTHGQVQNQMHSYSSPNMPYGQPAAFYGGYGMQMLNNGLSNMNLGGGYGAQGQWPNAMPQYQQNSYSGSYQQYSQGSQAVAGAGRYSHDSNQRAAVQQRKAQADEMYSNVSVPELVGQIYGLCKDQHGCRFLQKKLEERNEQDIQIIFEEVREHFTELMMDPFGNYLCQRLLEYANDDQRTVLVESAVSAMSSIALNQHGTRALQRMIEFISTPQQTNLVIEALRHDVVSMIQDLNGNHVIQKCLNHLSSQDAQFIFNAVGANCVIVGTHRHGCCVLQRCVDHASGNQKGALVDQIVANSFALVQDPFGNYVVQYIIDLSEPCFTEPLSRSLLGNISYLSKQKFSSNVIEKCIRCSGPETRAMLIREISASSEIEKLLRDSFANYVVQTAMDMADDECKALMIENIRPLLPSIRHTPYGRRISSKIQDYDGTTIGLPASQIPPSSMSLNSYSQNSMDSATTSPTPYASRGPPSGRGNRMGMVGAPPQWSGSNNGFGMHSGPNSGYSGMNDISSPAPQRNQAYNLLNGTQNYQSHSFSGPTFNNMSRQAPTYGHF